MHRSRVLLAALFATVLMSSASAFAQVCFYDHAGYQGISFCMHPGERYDWVGGQWDNRLSSISFHQNLQVRVCDYPNFGGACRVFSSNVQNLTHHGFNDMISSIEVLGGYYPPPPPPPPPSYGQVCFYEHAYFQGRSVCFEPNNFIPNLAKVGFNDQVSSIRVPWGVQVQACENRDFGGRCEYFTSDAHNLDGFFNDTISSVRATRY